MDNDQEQPQLRNNPVFVISIAVVLALVMIAISVFSYIGSDTRKTIEQIQLNNKSKSAQEIIPKGSEANIDLLTTIEKRITDDVQSHSDETDFSPNELTDSALGL
jgi:hypothetical protein